MNRIHESSISVKPPPTIPFFSPSVPGHTKQGQFILCGAAAALPPPLCRPSSDRDVLLDRMHLQPHSQRSQIGRAQPAVRVIGDQIAPRATTGALVPFCFLGTLESSLQRPRRCISSDACSFSIRTGMMRGVQYVLRGISLRRSLTREPLAVARTQDRLGTLGLFHSFLNGVFPQ